MTRAIDIVLAACGVILLVAFLGILVSYVDRLPLTIVCLIGVAGAIYDFWRTLFRNNGGVAPR